MLDFLGFAMSAESAPGIPRRSCKIEADATDGVTVAPSSHKVLFENADIRVLDVTVPANTKERGHTHARPAVMWFLPDISRPPFQIRRRPASKSSPIPAEGPHALENTGDIGAHAIRFELKHPTPVSQ